MQKLGSCHISTPVKPCMIFNFYLFFVFDTQRIIKEVFFLWKLVLILPDWIIRVDKVLDPKDYGTVSFRFRPERKKIMKASNRTAARHTEIFWGKTALTVLSTGTYCYVNKAPDHILSHNTDPVLRICMFLGPLDLDPLVPVHGPDLALGHLSSSKK